MGKIGEYEKIIYHQKETLDELEKYMQEYEKSRTLSIAKTKMEEAVMWLERPD